MAGHGDGWRTAPRLPANFLPVHLSHVLPEDVSVGGHLALQSLTGTGQQRRLAQHQALNNLTLQLKQLQRTVHSRRHTASGHARECKQRKTQHNVVIMPP